MHVPLRSTVRALRRLAPALAGAWLLAACGDQHPVATRVQARAVVPPQVIQAFDCAGSTSGGVSCRALGAGASGPASRVIIGGQGVYVQLTSSNSSYDSLTEIFSFDVTVKNLMNEAIGTPDGIVADSNGIRVFFHNGPVVTSGSGTAEVNNPDGYDTFTSSNQPYFTYPEILEKNEVSAARRWEISVPPGTGFSFQVYVSTEVQYLLVINELLANPGGTITDANGEWFEVYNAGTRAVNLQNLVIADSSTSGRRPYHLLSVSLSVPSGGYVVLGNTTDMVSNGGVDVDYAYGAAILLANSVDAVKIGRVYGGDTLTVDRAVYASAATSAQNGISRELVNPALDNTNVDGSSWANASVSAVYGAGGRGTPGAQNSAYVP